MKLLAWGLFILVLLWLLRGKKGTGGAASAGGRKADKGTEVMVQCAHCGIYIPVSDSVAAASGTSYCSEEHRLRHAS